MSIDALSFGCRLNAHESEQARARAAADGLTDAVIINTCAVTAEAVRQARQAIRKTRRERPGAVLIATGCAVQVNPDAFAAMPELDRVVGNGLKSAEGAYAPDAPRVQVGDVFTLRQPAAHVSGAGQGERARAYVEVQNGCDHRCTFCVIPFGRGNSRSTPAAEVVARVRELAAQGYAEVVLTGVDMTSWGGDLDGTPPLGELVAAILREVPELPRLRLSSIDAAEIDPVLLKAFAEERRLMPHLHLSLQSGDDMILKRMKRRHSRADSLALVAKLRAARPDAALGCDLIAGFPTETEEMFGNTLKLVVEAGLAYCHVFPYSARPGTPAASMPNLDKAVVKDRAERLRAAAAQGLARHLDARIGRTVMALVERPGLARAEDFTEIAFDGEAKVGQIIAMTLLSHDGRRAQGALQTRAAA